MSKLPLLSSPIQIGSLTMKNRMMTTSMSPGHHYISDDGVPTERMYNFLEEEAAGGIALICLTICFYPRLASQMDMIIFIL
jgi:2,4-dienoyl-CoA reductase (NADPH2)